MTHMLPPLPYAVSALEPHIDARTMTLHHDLHHGSYVTALNLALAAAPEMLRQKTAEWLLLNPGKVPENIRSAVRNNAGGHVNHGLLWRAMAPGGGGQPTGKLAEAIEHGFDSFEKFKTQFEDAGRRLFGSGCRMVTASSGSSPRPGTTIPWRRVTTRCWSTMSGNTPTT